MLSIRNDLEQSASLFAYRDLQQELCHFNSAHNSNGIRSSARDSLSQLSQRWDTWQLEYPGFTKVFPGSLVTPATVPNRVHQYL